MSPLNSSNLPTFINNLPGYKVISLLGKGAMGSVFLAIQNSTSRKVAIKVLNENLVKEKSAHKRLKEEALLTSKMKHKNIISLYDLIDYQGLYFLILEYCPGTPLSILSSKNKIPMNKVISYIEQILRALSYAHDSNIIHHDIKTSNILVLPDDTAVLCDFGLSSIYQEPNPENRNILFGTPRYMPPEKILHKDEHDPVGIDLFSLGVVFYRVLTMQYPFEAENEEKLFNKILKIVPKAPAHLDDNIPLSISAIIMKLLEKNPKKRYLSCREVLDDIQNYKSNLKVEAFGQDSIFTFFFFLKRNKNTLLLATLLLAIIILFIGYFSHTTVSNKPNWKRTTNSLFTFSPIQFIRNWDSTESLSSTTNHHTLSIESYKIIDNNFVSKTDNQIRIKSKHFLPSENFKLESTFNFGQNKNSYISFSLKGLSSPSLFLTLTRDSLQVSFGTSLDDALFEKRITNIVSDSTKSNKVYIESIYPIINISLNNLDLFQFNILWLKDIYQVKTLGFILYGQDTKINEPTIYESSSGLHTPINNLIYSLIQKNEIQKAIHEIESINFSAKSSKDVIQLLSDKIVLEFNTHEFAQPPNHNVEKKLNKLDKSRIHFEFINILKYWSDHYKEEIDLFIKKTKSLKSDNLLFYRNLLLQSNLSNFKIINFDQFRDTLKLLTRESQFTDALYLKIFIKGFNTVKASNLESFLNLLKQNKEKIKTALFKHPSITNNFVSEVLKIIQINEKNNYKATAINYLKFLLSLKLDSSFSKNIYYSLSKNHQNLGNEELSKLYLEKSLVNSK